MKPRPRWEVRVYSRNFFREHVHWVIGERIVNTTELLSERTYRWRWLASLMRLVHSMTPSIGGSVFWAELHRAPPKLRAVTPTRPGSNPLPTFAKPAPPPNPPAPPLTARSPGKDHSEGVGAGRAPPQSGRA